VIGVEAILYLKANMVSVCGDKQGKVGVRQGRAGQPRQTPAHNRSFSVTLRKATVVVSVCVGGQCLEDSSSHCPFPVELPQM